MTSCSHPRGHSATLNIEHISCQRIGGPFVTFDSVHISCQQIIKLMPKFADSTLFVVQIAGTPPVRIGIYRKFQVMSDRIFGM